MERKVRNRVLRPSTREASSSYKVDCKKVTRDDILEINITHETDPTVNFKYEISGQDLKERKSLHFDAFLEGKNWRISWQESPQPRRII